MVQSLALVLSLTLSAAPDLTPTESVFAEIGNDVLTQFASVPESDSLIRGQMPGGGMLQSAAAGWRVNAGTIVLSRQDPKPQVLLQTGAGAPRADASQFNFDHESGWMLTVGRNFGDVLGAEVRYFEIDGWDAAFGVQTVGGAGVPYFGGGVANQIGSFGPVNLLNDLRYSSQLTSLEANVRVQLTDNLVGLVGYRRLELHDRLTIWQNDIGAFNADVTHDIRAQNDLNGGQLGVEAMLVERESFRIDAFLKAGVYNNEASNKLGYYSDFFGINVATGREENVSSFVGEAGLTGTLQLTPSIAIRAGYLCLWIDEIAQPTEQPLANPRPNSEPARHVDAGSYQIMQGGQFSLEFAY